MGLREIELARFVLENPSFREDLRLGGPVAFGPRLICGSSSCYFKGTHEQTSSTANGFLLHNLNDQ